MSEANESYRISVPGGKVSAARDALGKLGIELLPDRPPEELMAMRETDQGNLYATAGQIPWMLDQVNRHLLENRLTPGLRTNHENWTAEESLDFLEMCLTEFDWEEGRIAHAEFHDQEEWEDIQDKWSRLPMSAGERPPSPVRRSAASRLTGGRSTSGR